MLGWIIFGSSPTATNYSLHASSDQDLHDLFLKFWSQEETPYVAAQPLSLDNEECEKHFTNTHSRDTSGRYIVRLPLKASTRPLGDSSYPAELLQSMQKRISASSALRTLCYDLVFLYTHA